jgi:hypothetical protein
MLKRVFGFIKVRLSGLKKILKGCAQLRTGQSLPESQLEGEAQSKAGHTHGVVSLPETP